MSEPQTDSDMAARWLLRMDEPGWTERHQRAFDRWLGPSASRRAVFWRLEHGWSAADRITSLNVAPERAERRIAVWKARLARPLKMASMSLTMAAALATFWILRPETLPEAPASSRLYSTAANGHRSVETADGSRIDMAAATLMKTRVSSLERDVWLSQGEAFFDVRHAKNHPFRVHAGGNVVTVLGTRFSVRYVGGELRVVVFSGLVQIAHNEGPGSASGLIVLPKNKMATINDASIAIEGLPGRGASLVTFEEKPIAAVIARFPGLAGKTVVFSNDKVADVRVSGNFKPDNDAGFIRLLERAYGLKVTSSPSQMTIGVKE